MADTVLDKAIVFIYETGFFDYALPFMVTFAVVYGLLQKTEIFGENNERINAIFALVVGLIIMPFAANVSYITYLAKFVLIIIGFTALAIVLGLFGFRFEEHRKYSPWIALVFVIFLVGTEFLDITAFIRTSVTTELLYTVIIILIFALVIWLVIGGKEGSSEAEESAAAETATPDYQIKKVARIPGEELSKPGKKYPK